MTKIQFKTRWELNERGDGITFYDIANCAIEWGLFSKPKIERMEIVIYKVLIAAECIDAERFVPYEEL